MKPPAAIKFWVVLFGLLSGLLIAHFSVPFIYQNIPSDFERTQLLLDVFQNKKLPPVLLLGNSVLMNGIDAKQLSKELGETAYNLGSTDQTLRESLLYYQYIPKGPRKVVQFLYYEELLKERKLTKQKVRHFLMHGFRPTPVTYMYLGHKARQLFEEPLWQTHFSMRGIIINTINTQLRRIMRTDLVLNNLGSELFFPATYKEKIASEKIQKMIDYLQPKKPLSTLTLDKDSVAMLKRAAHQLQLLGVNYYVVIQPIHPNMDRITSHFKKDLKNKLQALDIPNLKFIFFQDLLTADDFSDHMHPFGPGSITLTQTLARELNP